MPSLKVTRNVANQAQKGEGGMQTEILFLGIRQKVQKEDHFTSL